MSFIPPFPQMPKVPAFSNLNAARSANATPADMVCGYGVPLGALAVQAAALVADPLGILLGFSHKNSVPVAAKDLAIHRTRGVAFAGAHSS
jgi:hypothetical protein